MTAPDPHPHHYLFLGGRITPVAEARISVLDRGFLYGDSVYEVTRTVGGRPLLWAEHAARLARSAAGLGFTAPERTELDAAVTATLLHTQRAAAVSECYLRVMVTRGSGPIDLDPAAAQVDGRDAPTLLVLAKPLRLPPEALYRDGASVWATELRRNAPGHVPAWVKSGNYLSSVLALAEARRHGAYEALLRGEGDTLVEGASSNIFIVQGGSLLSVPEAAGILPGITRAVLLKLARSAGIPVVETCFSGAQMRAADEALLTSSVRGIVPVTRLDDARIGDGRPGPVTRQLMALYARHIADGTERADAG